MANAMAQPIRANRFSDTCRNTPAQMGAGADAENSLLLGERPILRWLVRMRLDTSGLPNPVNRKAVCKVPLPMQATLVRRAPQLAVGSLAATCQEHVLQTGCKSVQRQCDTPAAHEQAYICLLAGLFAGAAGGGWTNGCGAAPHRPRVRQAVRALVHPKTAASAAAVAINYI